MKKAESVEKEALEFLDAIERDMTAAAKQAVTDLEEVEWSKAKKSRSPFDSSAFVDYLRVKSQRAATASRQNYLLGHAMEIVDGCAQLFAAKNATWPKRRDEIGDQIAAIVKCQALGKPSPQEAQQLEKKLMALEIELETGDRQTSAASNLIEAFRAASQSQIESCFRQLTAFARAQITDLAEAVL